MVITAVSYNKLAVKNVLTAGSYYELAVMRSTSSLLVGVQTDCDDRLSPPVGKTKRR
jgi:hypothetical protein